MVTTDVLHLLSDEELLDDYWRRKGDLEELAKRLGHVEQEIFARMDNRESTAIPSETYVCEAVTKNEYDHTAFTPLKEVFNDADLATCYEPEHTETKPVHYAAKWNTVKVIALAKRYGLKAEGIVARARSQGRPKLKFERRG